MKVCLVEFEQETSHFNPQLTKRDGFSILEGEALIEHFADTNTYVAGGIDVFSAEGIASSGVQAKILYHQLDVSRSSPCVGAHVVEK